MNIMEEQNSFCDQHNSQNQHAHQSVNKWMSSKMRLMRKMIGSDHILIDKTRTEALQDQKLPNEESSSSSSTSNNNNSSSGIIRFCSNCNTTKTPLWRSGPQGPKSLCNACGIRQMKARRAMAAAAVLGSGLTPTDAPNKAQKKEKKSDIDRTVPLKKRYKITSYGAAQKKLCFDDSTISLSKNSACHQAFPQEEKDAAILLMALSCGLLYG